MRASAPRMREERGPLYATASWLCISQLHPGSFILSPACSLPVEKSQTWPCPDEASDLSREISSPQATYAQPPGLCVTLTVEGYFLFLFHKSHPLQIF